MNDSTSLPHSYLDRCVQEYAVDIWNSIKLGSRPRTGLRCRFWRLQQQFYYLKLKSTVLNLRIFQLFGHRELALRRGLKVWNALLAVEKFSYQQELPASVYHQMSHITRLYCNQLQLHGVHLSGSDLFKSARTVWFCAAWQLIIGKPIVLTDAILAYNALYPLTDGVLDSPTLSSSMKYEFVVNFGARLAGKQTQDSTLFTTCDRMVTLIEGVWDRGSCGGVYNSLCYIHAAQAMSVQQQSSTACMPERTFLTNVTCTKGAASVLAAACVVGGQLNQNEIRFLCRLGLALQLLDDLQDVNEDVEMNHHTLFSDRLLRGELLDEPTGQLLDFLRHPEVLYEFDLVCASPVATSVRQSMKAMINLLILEAASKCKRHYSTVFYRSLERMSLVPLEALREVRIEDALFRILNDKLF